MASTDKTAKLAGSLSVIADGGNSPAETIFIEAISATLNTSVSGAFTLANSAVVTIAMSNYGMTTAAHYFFLKCRSTVDGTAKSVGLTVTQTTTAVNGLTPSASFSHLTTDFFHLSTQNPRITQVVVTAQNAGDEVEVVWAAGGT